MNKSVMFNEHDRDIQKLPNKPRRWMSAATGAAARLDSRETRWPGLRNVCGLWHAKRRWTFRYHIYTYPVQSLEDAVAS